MTDSRGSASAVPDGLGLLDWKSLRHRASRVVRLGIGRALVLAAVEQDPAALQYAGDFRDDEEVAMRAVVRNGNMLRHASVAVRACRRVVLQAVARANLKYLDTFSHGCRLSQSRPPEPLVRQQRMGAK